MTPTATLPLERRLEHEGVVFASPSEIRALFDRQASQVGVTGQAAIERIQSGDTGPELAWEELALLYLLL
jgi:hypothetical protein